MAIASAACCNTVHAQSSVHLYGLIDTTISYTNHADSQGHNLVQFATPWFSGSRWGLTGAEDIGGGTKAIFKLESEFLTSTGEMDTPGVIFNRDAWIGVQNETLGKLTFGRQNALARDVSGIYSDPYTSASLSTEETGYTNNNNFKQLIFYASSATGTRMDNGAVWKKLWDNGLFAGIGFQFGNVPGSFSTNTTYTGALGYNGQNFHVSAFYDQAKVNQFTDKSFSIGGNYIFDILRLNAGYFHYSGEQGALGQRTDNAYTMSVKVAPRGAFDYELGYQIMHASNAAYSASTGATLQGYNPIGLATTTGSGRKNTLYASVFYHFSKRTEVYLAADYMKLYQGYRVATAPNANNQFEFAVGMRTRF
ncbi:porin [Cupriavidus sp. D39]|nr:porin [Cupriavidus sp. D39]MCY0853160.1 porin [Cupriavidus sp. D39]